MMLCLPECVGVSCLSSMLLNASLSAMSAGVAHAIVQAQLCTRKHLVINASA